MEILGGASTGYAQGMKRFLSDLRGSHSQAQMIQLASSAISLFVILKRFRKASGRVKEFRLSQITDDLPFV